MTVGGSRGQFGQLPSRSQRVYPAQLISSITAALICLFLWAYYPFRRRDGEVLALLVTIYPVLADPGRNDSCRRTQRLVDPFSMDDFANDQQPSAPVDRGAVAVRAVATQGQCAAASRGDPWRLCRLGRVGGASGSFDKWSPGRDDRTADGPSRPNPGLGGTFGAGNTSE